MRGKSWGKSRETVLQVEKTTGSRNLEERKAAKTEQQEDRPI